MLITSAIVNVILFVVCILLIVVVTKESKRKVEITKDMPDDFAKQTSMRKSQIALMKFQKELYENRIVKYDFKNKKLTLKFKI
jgi:competence protein ComGC